MEVTDEANTQKEFQAEPTNDLCRQCFNLVQSRRFGAPVAASTVALCPSMDLLTMSFRQDHAKKSGLNASGNLTAAPVWLHRSLSFQKLATITNDINVEEEGVMEVNNDDTSPTSIPGSYSTVWQPDGRWLGVSDSKGRLNLFHVEALVKEATITMSTVFPATSSSASSFLPPKINHSLSYNSAMSGNAVRIQLSSSATVCGLEWSRIVEWNTSLQIEDSEEDGDEDQPDVSRLFAKARQRYADRSSLLLPASEYYPQYSGGDAHTSNGSHLQVQHSEGVKSLMMGGSPAKSVFPTSQTPLSILAVAFDTGNMELFLNGRYRISSGLRFHKSSNDLVPRVQMACSNDLSHILVLAQPANRDIATKSNITRKEQAACYSLYSIPVFAEQRYTLQTLSALYSSMMGHLHALPSLLTDVIESWKSSLKPLDMKLESLARLLRNYGLLTEDDGDVSTTTSHIRKHLVRYILSGHTAGSADLSNAMDQFFTGVQMNEYVFLVTLKKCCACHF